MRFLVLVALLAIVNSPASAGESLASPSGRHSVRAGVPEHETSPSFRDMLTLVFIDADTKRESTVFTGFPAGVDWWAIGWTSSDVLLLYARSFEGPFRTLAFEARGDRFEPREATEAEQKIAKKMYSEKVRKSSRPNQSLEPTPTAGTSAAEQPLVPAAVVAHL